MTRKICVALLIVASMTVTPAQGDETCQEITDPDIQFQTELCSAHVGCKLVVGIHSACTKVKSFLNKLKNLSFGKKTLDSGDVFEAAAPSTEGDERFNEISNSIKASYDKQPQKQVASGEFQNGGKWVYEGPMTNGKRNGTGVLLTESGTVFRGDFVDGRQVGMGESFNGESHKAGAMAGAKMNGFGVERNANGTRYEGGYLTDARNGQGTYKAPNGDQYTGNWVNNIKHGQGTYKWPDGNEYTGTWADGKRQGQGTFTWADGTRFEGEWRDGKKLNGTQISPDGTRIEIANGEAVKSPQQAAATPPTQPAPPSSAATSASSGSLAQACKAEQQRFISVYPRCRRQGCEDIYLETLNEVQRNMTDFSNYFSHIPCSFSKGNDSPICKAFLDNSTGKHPFSETSQTYADALMAMAEDVYTNNKLGGLRDYAGTGVEFLYITLKACVARHEANRIKAAAAPSTQPDSSRMRADESGSVNGRLRTADKPLFTCCDAQTTREHVNDFNHDWENREETLYQLGEKMVEWGDFKLQTIAGRAAFLQACDEKIAAARARARSK